jgi:hypothetical protein
LGLRQREALGAQEGAQDQGRPQDSLPPPPEIEVSWLRRHLVIVGVTTLGVLTLAFFTWADWYNYDQDQQEHNQKAEFYSVDFLAHWGDNAAQNWHSELIFGGAVLLALRGAKKGSEEQAEEEGT